MNIFNISSSKEFDATALEVFRFQIEHCNIYSHYVDLLGIDWRSVSNIHQIPFMPIAFFKSHEINCYNSHQICFTSSGTTTSVNAKHYVYDISVYEDSFIKSFSLFYDTPHNSNIYALLPSYLEREGSSLIYMVEKLIKESADGGFFLYDHNKLIERLKNRDLTRKTILFGVSFALLDMAEKYNIDLSDNVVVMETGGMKGRRMDVPREELHRILKNSFNVSEIHSEYGMCECLSQSYSNGNGIFRSPSWMKILVRDLHDPFMYIGNNRRGGVNIIDLANINSCSFLQTDDLGISYEDGSFSVEGRIDFSDIRGCNLLVDEV